MKRLQLEYSSGDSGQKRVISAKDIHFFLEYFKTGRNVLIILAILFFFFP